MSEHSYEYYSNGKLLITSEYLILKGAKALAVPVNYGQSLNAQINQNGENYIFSTSVKGENWLTCKFSLDNFELVDSNKADKCTLLQNLIIEANKLNPNRFTPGSGLTVSSFINFDINWGLGSSSSLISNIAFLFDVDPFELHRKVSNGSGYDVFCARSNSPILFNLENDMAVVEEVQFLPDFHSHIAFVYAGQKMDSSKSVARFLHDENNLDKEIDEVSIITDELLKVKDLNGFNKLVVEHEKLMSSILKTNMVKDLFFSNFLGEVKSLGAWGGDFLMVSSSSGIDYIKNYFSERSLDVVIPFHKMIL